METQEIRVTFTTSTDAEAKLAGEGIETTCTIRYTGWDQTDFNKASASRVIINHLQPQVRKGKRIPDVVDAPKPGTKGFIIAISSTQALIKMFGAEKAAVLIQTHGDADKAMEYVKQLIG